MCCQAFACSILLTLAAVAAGGAAEPATTPPVPLRTSTLWTPAESAGTGLAPEARLRVDVDDRGRVTAVEMVAIEPFSEFDDDFRRALEEAVSTWRYAPATAAGEPVATRLAWSVQFQPRSEATYGEGPAGGRSWHPYGEERDLEAAAALSLEQRKRLLSRWSQAAERSLDGAQRLRVESARFVVVTDWPERETAEVVVGNLEAVFTVLDQLVGDHLGSYPEPYKNVVYLYSRRAALGKLAAELGIPNWGSGFYSSPGFLAFHVETWTADSFLHVLLHEAVHAYNDRQLARPGTAFPSWMEEGFAEYIGNSQVKRGKLLPGRTLKGKYVLAHRGGAYRQATDAGWTLDDLKRSLRKGEGMSLDELLAAERPVFYGDQRRLYYALSWILVHFLRHGEEDWEVEKFPTLLLYLAEGYPAADALVAAYGETPRELNARFEEYARKF